MDNCVFGSYCLVVTQTFHINKFRYMPKYPLTTCQSNLFIALAIFIIRYFHRKYNAPFSSPLPTPQLKKKERKKKKNFMSIVFDFSWDGCNTQEKLKTMVT